MKKIKKMIIGIFILFIFIGFVQSITTPHANQKTSFTDISNFEYVIENETITLKHYKRNK